MGTTSSRETSAAFREERTLVQVFIDLLTQERGALLHGDIERAVATAEDKSRLAVQLAQLAQQRSRMLQAAGHTPDRSGMDAWIAAQPASAGLAGDWAELLRAMRAAHDANRINGLLIEAGLRANQQALAAIRSASDMESVYGPDGLSRSFVAVRPIETA